MTHSGITADVLGAGLDRIPQDKQGVILAEFPRLAFKNGLKDCLCNIVRRKPESTFDNIVRDFGVRYVEGYTSPQLCRCRRECTIFRIDDPVLDLPLVFFLLCSQEFETARTEAPSQKFGSMRRRKTQEERS